MNNEKNVLDDIKGTLSHTQCVICLLVLLDVELAVAYLKGHKPDELKILMVRIFYN